MQKQVLEIRSYFSAYKWSIGKFVKLTLDDKFTHKCQTEYGKKKVDDACIAYISSGFRLVSGNIGRKFIYPEVKEGKTQDRKEKFQSRIDIGIAGKFLKFCSGKVHPDKVIDSAGDE